MVVDRIDFKRYMSVVALYVVIPFSSYAAVNCEGAINNFQVTASGGVQVTSSEIWGNGVGRAVCYVSTEWKGVTVDACKAWVSILLSARVTQNPIKVQYSDGAVCNEIETWGNAIAPSMIDTM